MKWAVYDTFTGDMNIVDTKEDALIEYKAAKRYAEEKTSGHGAILLLEVKDKLVFKRD